MSSWHMRIHELQQWMTDDVVMIYLVIIWHWWRESFVSTCLGVFCEFSEVLNDSYKRDNCISNILFKQTQIRMSL